LQTSDVDLTRGLLLVRKGKGAKGRYAPFKTQWEILALATAMLDVWQALV
jgi:hypothetical protein